MPDGRPNLNTHVYGHRDLVSEENLAADHLEPGAKLIIRHVVKRFDRRHAGEIKQLGLSANIMEKMLDANVVCKLQGDLLNEVTRPIGPMRIKEIIEQICSRQSVELPVSLPVRMPAPPSQQRAGPSGQNTDTGPCRRRIDLFEEEEDTTERPVRPPSKRI